MTVSTGSGRVRSGRFYQAVCVVAAAAVLLGVAWPAHLRLNAAKNALLPQGQRVGDMRELDSFAVGLLLGGFRGPLVMYLWVTSEDEKNRDETEKFLTRSELISELQPQYVSIYTHQSWNLAYNVSVQYNRPSEKYRWIIAGIEFAEKGERRIPANTDIIEQLGHLYFDKLGESFERDYYRARFRHDSLDQLLDNDRRLRDYALPGEDAGPPATRWKYIDRLDAMLDQIRRDQQRTGKLLDPLLPPADRGPDARHHWPFGVSVFAVAYDYFKQAEITGPHTQFGQQVMSSRPAIACRAWIDDEIDLALAAESQLWPMNQPGRALGAPTSELLAAHQRAVDEALFHCREAQSVALLAQAGYQSHMARFPYQADTFATHLSHVAIKTAFAQASARRLAGIMEMFPPTQTPPLAAGTPRGDAQTRERLAREKLVDARVEYLNAIQLIRDYLATEYRIDPWSNDRDSAGRAPYDLLADQAQRAVDQIDRLLLTATP